MRNCLYHPVMNGLDNAYRGVELEKKMGDFCQENLALSFVFKNE